jgi:hypothetical protein
MSDFPTITGFDGRTIQTAEGCFTIQPVVYADGGPDKGGKPRFESEQFGQLWRTMVREYVSLSRSNLTFPCGAWISSKRCTKLASHVLSINPDEREHFAEVQP